MWTKRYPHNRFAYLFECKTGKIYSLLEALPIDCIKITYTPDTRFSALLKDFLCFDAIVAPFILVKIWRENEGTDRLKLKTLARLGLRIYLRIDILKYSIWSHIKGWHFGPHHWWARRCSRWEKTKISLYTISKRALIKRSSPPCEIWVMSFYSQSPLTWTIYRYEKQMLVFFWSNVVVSPHSTVNTITHWWVMLVREFIGLVTGYKIAVREKMTYKIDFTGGILGLYKVDCINIPCFFM